MNTLQAKYEHLKSLLKEMGGIVVGYSGGVDSTFLAKVATDVLGDQALSVAAISESYPKAEREEGRQFAEQLGLNYIEVETSELENPEYRRNESNRCFFCKQELMIHLQQVANERGIEVISLGTVTDDLGDYRPGQSAAKQAGARFPLVEADLSKDDVRALSQALEIPTWDKPAFACLSSRFPYGEEITREKLEMVEQAEDVLREMGFRQFRVRHHNNLARVEVAPEEMESLFRQGETVYQRLKDIGYQYIAMDLKGYRSGSMNEVLVQIETPLSLQNT